MANELPQIAVLCVVREEAWNVMFTDHVRMNVFHTPRLHSARDSLMDGIIGSSRS